MQTFLILNYIRCKYLYRLLFDDHWQSVPSISAILWNVLAKKFIAKFGIIWKIQVSQNCYSLKYDLLEMVWIIFLPFRTFPNLIYRSPRRVYRVTTIFSLIFFRFLRPCLYDIICVYHNNINNMIFGGYRLSSSRRSHYKYTIFIDEI